MIGNTLCDKLVKGSEDPEGLAKTEGLAKKGPCINLLMLDIQRSRHSQAGQDILRSRATRLTVLKVHQNQDFPVLLLQTHDDCQLLCNCPCTCSIFNVEHTPWPDFRRCDALVATLALADLHPDLRLTLSQCLPRLFLELLPHVVTSSNFFMHATLAEKRPLQFDIPQHTRSCQDLHLCVRECVCCRSCLSPSWLIHHPRIDHTHARANLCHFPHTRVKKTPLQYIKSRRPYKVFKTFAGHYELVLVHVQARHEVGPSLWIREGGQEEEKREQKLIFAKMSRLSRPNSCKCSRISCCPDFTSTSFGVALSFSVSLLMYRDALKMKGVLRNCVSQSANGNRCFI